MTARKVITRSKKTFRAKFPSRKNNCMIHCESILEADTARLLEISYFVKNFRAQPSEEIYYDNEGNPRTYYPDFEAILMDDTVLHIEVKPSSKLCRPDIKGKLEAIARRYEEQGRRFRVITEKSVQSEPLLSNLKLILYHLRAPITGKNLNRLMGSLARHRFSTVAQAAAILGKESLVYALIGAGHLAADFNQELNMTSSIWIRNSTNGGENDPLRI